MNRFEKNVFLLFLIFLGIYFSSCTPARKVQQKPLWVLKLKSLAYPEQDYIQGIGTAEINGSLSESMAIADNAAKVEVAKQIRLNLNASSQTLQQEVSNLANGQSMSKVEFRQSIEARVNFEKLEGLSISARFQDEEANIFYSLATLDLEKATFSISAKIKEARKKAEEYRLLSTTTLENGEIIHALGNLSALLKILDELKDLEEFHFILKKEYPEKWQVPIRKPVIEAKISAILGDISLSIFTGNNQKGELNQPLPEKLLARLTYKSNSKTIYNLPEIPLFFSFLQGKGKLQARGISDNNGLATCEVYLTEPTGLKYNSILAKADLADFTPPGFTVPKLEIIFSYTLPSKEELKLGLILDELSEGKRNEGNLVEDKIKERLTKEGFQLLPKSLFNTGKKSFSDFTQEELLKKFKGKFDLLVYGSIISTVKGIPGELSPFYFLETSASVNILNSKSGKIFKTLSFNPVQESKGIGNTKAQALQNSLNKIAPLIADSIFKELQGLFNSGTY